MLHTGAGNQSQSQSQLQSSPSNSLTSPYTTTNAYAAGGPFTPVEDGGRDRARTIPSPAALASDGLDISLPSPYDQLINQGPGPSENTIFGSARMAFEAPQTFTFNYTLPSDVQSQQLGLDGIRSASSSDPSHNYQPSFQQLVSAMGNVVPSPEPVNANAGSSQRLPISPANTNTANHPSTSVSGNVGNTQPTDEFSQISVFATWEQVGFFLSLHMRHQHVLVPLVHQPSFARDLLHRRDIHDEIFRGLLLSIVAYTICQCPIRLFSKQMDRPELEALLSRCLKGSRAIQIRNQLSASPHLLASTILDWISSQATGKEALQASLMADVRRLVYALRLQENTSNPNLSFLDIQIRRRLFWEAYVIDKTNALNGYPMSLYDLEGVAPMPMEVDDDYLTMDSSAGQPPNQLSLMVGFNAVNRVFHILGQCLIRNRTYRTDRTASPPAEVLTQWVNGAREQLHTLVNSLPAPLRPDYSPELGEHFEQKSVYGTQQANILMTTLCLELALLDLESDLAPHVDVSGLRKVVTERAFRQLSNIPIEYLASNGESMRGKVLRVVMSLLSTGDADTQQLSSDAWDWWSMYSRVQFLQMIPDNKTRPPSPSRNFLSGGPPSVPA